LIGLELGPGMPILLSEKVYRKVRVRTGKMLKPMEAF
jgi:hypothetical protein